MHDSLSQATIAPQEQTGMDGEPLNPMPNGPRMRADDFRDWLERMGLSTRTGSELLGWSRKTLIDATKGAGAPHYIALACQALAHGLRPFRKGDSISEDARDWKRVLQELARDERAELQRQRLADIEAAEVEKIKRAAARAKTKYVSRHHEIAAAVADGESLREVAARFDLSYEGVRKITARVIAEQKKRNRRKKKT